MTLSKSPLDLHDSRSLLQSVETVSRVRIRATYEILKWIGQTYVEWYSALIVLNDTRNETADD
jgi:hypothetical protein